MEKNRGTQDWPSNADDERTKRVTVVPKGREMADKIGIERPI